MSEPELSRQFPPTGIEGVHVVQKDAETMHLAARFSAGLGAGDVVLLSGPLGAGKTTFVRGFLRALGHEGPVRSPTFNLIQAFDTEPPVCHVDLYRVSSASGLGLEDYLDTHVLLIEWPDRLGAWIDPRQCWQVTIGFEGDGRRIEIHRP